jgi:Phytanoyl-CoA dioxygenase (PhyH)
MQSSGSAVFEAPNAPPLTDEEIAERIEEIGSPGYWQKLCPDVSVGRHEPSFDIEEAPLAENQRKNLIKRLERDGYFKSERVLSESLILRMRSAMSTLRENGLPPVFAYIFDEFWDIVRAPSVQTLVTEALGPGCRQSPRVWAFHLSTDNGAAGWPPHVDGGHLAHTTDRLTLWLPLTDVTLENGCMNVVPKHLLPATLPDHFANDARSLSPEIWKTMLQGARALPARAGSLLAWDFQVVHWSSLCDGATEPRMSLAVEIMGPSIEPTEGELPLFDLKTLPPFRERLEAIAKGLLSYQRFEPQTLRYKGLARRMLDKIHLEIW